MKHTVLLLLFLLLSSPITFGMLSESELSEIKGNVKKEEWTDTENYFAHFENGNYVRAYRFTKGPCQGTTFCSITFPGEDSIVSPLRNEVFDQLQNAYNAQNNK